MSIIKYGFYPEYGLNHVLLLVEVSDREVAVAVVNPYRYPKHFYDYKCCDDSDERLSVTYTNLKEVSGRGKVLEYIVEA